MLEGARAAAGAEAMQVRDIAEIVADSLDEVRTP
jgi:hypothetical protein